VNIKKTLILLLFLPIFLFTACSDKEFVPYDRHSDVPDLGIVLSIYKTKTSERQGADNSLISAYVYDALSTTQYNTYVDKLTERHFKVEKDTEVLEFLDKFFFYMLYSTDGLNITPTTANYFKNQKTMVAVVNGLEKIDDPTSEYTSHTVTFVYVMSLKEVEYLRKLVETTETTE
jgi:hypothetical protein